MDVLSSNVFSPKQHLISSSEGAGAVKKAGTYLYNAAERTIQSGWTNTSLGRFERVIGVRSDEDAHQEGVTQAPLQYIFSPPDTKNFPWHRRTLDILFGSTTSAFPEFIGKALATAGTTVVLALLIIGAALEGLFTQSFKYSGMALKVVAPVWAESVSGTVREGLRSIPIVGHFLGKGFDTLGVISNDFVNLCISKVRGE